MSSASEMTTKTGVGPDGVDVQKRGHTITTVKQTEKTTRRNQDGGNPTVKTKKRTVYYVDGKPVKLNWLDKMRIKVMSQQEKQAFLAERLLSQERKG